jgi:pantothenate kinase
MNTTNDETIFNNSFKRLSMDDKTEGRTLISIMTSPNSSKNAKSDALTQYIALFTKRGMKDPFFTNNGLRKTTSKGGKRKKHTLRKKRAARKTRRHQ